jgi:hypothetical protein
MATKHWWSVLEIWRRELTLGSTGHSAEVANAGVLEEESTDGATGH